MKNSKLAIVAISFKYFGREWTKFGIKELFKRQFPEGRKLILLLPIIRNYLSTEEGKRNLAEWTAERKLNKTETKKESR